MAGVQRCAKRFAALGVFATRAHAMCSFRRGKDAIDLPVGLILLFRFMSKPVRLSLVVLDIEVLI